MANEVITILKLSEFKNYSENRSYDISKFIGFGKKTLKKNIQTINGILKNLLTLDMFYKGEIGNRIPNINTVFIILHDFDLNGENIIIPENCILEFDGGSINNGTLNLQNTTLKGKARFGNITVFSGNITNDVFDVTWITNGDIGAKINSAQANFKSLFVPNGEFTMTTPVILEAIEKLESHAVLRYAGTYKNCEGIFLIHNSVNAVITFNKLTPLTLTGLDYTKTRTINIVGLEIRGCNNCSVNVQSIGYFNENIRISDLEGYGCCYNRFYFQEVCNGNANVRIYQHRLEGGKSWCNENTFDGGRYTHYSSNKVDTGYAPVPWFDANSTPVYIEGDTANSNCTKDFYERYLVGGLCFDPHDFVIGGPALDEETNYTTSPRDDYDSINAIVIQNASLEKSWNPIVARNAAFKMINNRDEGNPYAAKLIGNCSNLDYQSRYNGNQVFLKSDVSMCDWLRFVEPSKIFSYDEDISLSNKLKTFDGKNVPYNMYLATNNGIINTIRNDNSTYKGVIVDTSIYKMFHIRRNNYGRFYIMYLNTNNENISDSYSDDKPTKWMSYTNTMFVDSADLVQNTLRIPNNISKVFVGVRAIEDVETMTIYTADKSVFTSTLAVRGTTANRPLGLPLDVAYFDTDFNIPLYWNGADWVNGNDKIPSTGDTINKIEIPIIMGSEPTIASPNFAYGDVCYNSDTAANILHIENWNRKMLGVVIDTSIVKNFKLYLKDTEDNDLRTSFENYSVIQYLNNGAAAFVDNMNTYPRPHVNATYSGLFSAFTYAAYYKGFTIPDNVNYIFVGLMCRIETSVVAKFVIESQEGAVKTVNILPNSGTTAERPPQGKVPVGYMYFDTDLGSNGGKPIYATGTEWVDATGTPV